MLTSFETSGDIREVDLLAAFVALWRERGHGAVSFSRGGASAAFQIAEGDVVSVSSSEARFDSSAILVRAGKLDAAALERLAVPEGTDGALAALQAGILTRREWRWGEKIRAIEVLADLLGWADGKYYFDADARPSGGEFRLTIPRLILELFLRSRDRNLVEHQLGPSDAPLVRARDFESEFTTFGLTADAESVVRLIDGRATADEIARSAPADDFAVRKLLAALTTLGLIHAAGAAEPASAPAATRAPAPAALPEEIPTRQRGEAEPAGAAAFGEYGTPPAERESPLGTRAIDVPAAETPVWDLPAPEPSGRSDAVELDAPASPLEAFALPAGRRSDLAEPRLEEEPPPGSSGPELGAEPAGFEGVPMEPSRDGSEPPRGSGLGRILLLILAVLVLGIAAVLFLRSRPVTTDSAAVIPTAAPTAVAAAPTAAPPTSVPSPSVSRAAAAPTAAPIPTRIPPSPVPARAEPRAAEKRPAKQPAARESAGTAGAVASVPASRADWIARAERDRKRLARERSVRYAIQLELACEVASLAEAWKHDRPPGTMWLLTTKHGGRDCYRVLWGRYPSLDAAKRAKPGIPGFFTTASNRPAVVSVR